MSVVCVYACVCVHMCVVCMCVEATVMPCRLKVGGSYNGFSHIRDCSNVRSSLLSPPDGNRES